MILTRAGIGKVGKDTELALAMYYRSSTLANYVVPYSRLEDSNKLQERASRAVKNFRNYTKKVVRSYIEGLYRRQDQIIRTSTNATFHAWLDDYYDTWFRRSVAPFALLLPELWVMIVPTSNGGFKPIVIFPSFVHDFILAPNNEVLSCTLQLGTKMMRIDHNDVTFYSSIGEGPEVDWQPEEPVAHHYGFCPVIRICFEENAEIEEMDGTPVGHSFMYDVIYDNLADLQLRSIMQEAIHDHMYYQLVAGEETITNTVRRGMGSDVPIAEASEEKGTTRYLTKPSLEMSTLRSIINEDMPTQIFEDARLQSRHTSSAQTGAARAYDLYPENGVLTEISNFLGSADARIVGMIATLLRVKASVSWPSVFDTRSAGDLLQDANTMMGVAEKLPISQLWVREYTSNLQHITLPGADSALLKRMDDETKGAPIPFLVNGQDEKAGDANLPAARSGRSQAAKLPATQQPGSNTPPKGDGEDGPAALPAGGAPGQPTDSGGPGDVGNREVAAGGEVILVTNVTPGDEEDDYADIYRGLTEAGYEVTFANINNSLEALTALVDQRGPMVWNAVEAFNDRAQEEMNVAAFFEMAQLHFTGSSAKTLGLLQDKALTKTILAGVGVPVKNACLLRYGKDYPDMSHLAWPRMVKPSAEDASEGITVKNVTHNEQELEAAIDRVFQVTDSVLVEEYAEGREILVAILGNGEERRILPPMEIQFHGEAKIVTQDAKQDSQSKDFNEVASVPAELTQTELAEIERVVLTGARALEVKDYARVDIRLTKEGAPVIIEINPNPDLTPEHGFGGSAQLAGIDFPTLLSMIVEMARKRYED